MNNDILHIAFIGMGYRGKQLLSLIRHISGYHVTAIADPEAREEDYGVPCYNRGGEDYRRMIKEQAPQLVFIASPWLLHVTHALYMHSKRVPRSTGNKRRTVPERIQAPDTGSRKHRKKSVSDGKCPFPERGVSIVPSGRKRRDGRKLYTCEADTATTCAASCSMTMAV